MGMRKSVTISSSVACVLGVLVVACAGTPESVTDQATPAGSVELKITESGLCPQNGIMLRVEIANRTDMPQRVQICDNLQLSCIVDSHVSVKTCSTAYSLLDPGLGAESRVSEVYLVKGATYSYPIVLGLDRFPEDCFKSTTPLAISVSLRMNENWIESNEIEVAISRTDG